MHAVVISPACVMHTCSLNFFHLKSAAISIKRSSDHQNEQDCSDRIVMHQFTFGHRSKCSPNVTTGVTLMWVVK